MAMVAEKQERLQTRAYESVTGSDALAEASVILTQVGIDVAEDGAYTILLNGRIKVTVSPTGNVTAYTSDGALPKRNIAIEDKRFIKDENSVSVHGARIALTPEGHLAVSTTGSFTVFPTVASSDKIAVPAVHAEKEVGQRMPDGTIYAGISPSTGRDMYVTPKDLKGIHSGLARFGELKGLMARFNKRASKKNFGHTDWHMPTEAELEVLYRICEKGALRKTFDRRSGINGWYWSSKETGPSGAKRLRFGDGQWHNAYKGIESGVRLVRG